MKENNIVNTIKAGAALETSVVVGIICIVVCFGL